MHLRGITRSVLFAVLLVSVSGAAWSQVQVERSGSAQGTSDDSGEFWFTDVRPGANAEQESTMPRDSGGPVPTPYPNIGNAEIAPGRANVAGEPTDTQTDSVVDELGGIVVLCNNQSDEQNACEPRDSATSDGEANIRFGDGIRGARSVDSSGDDDSERRVPEALRHRDR